MVPITPLRMVSLLAVLALLAGAACYGIAYFASGLNPGVVLVIVMTCGWLLAGRRNYVRLLNPLLFAWVLLAAVGMGIGVSAIWLLSGFVCVLAAFDLERYRARLSVSARIQDPHSLVKTHLRRLLIVTGSGWALGGFALAAGLSIDFGTTALLSTAVAFSLIIGLSSLRSRSEAER